ncbi:AraC family transcriptional regulator [Lacrimispora sp. BS-2]|uniref:AraC family transcriptional regulator n=1 Tax=Lacrimispora sp. BS-2 TaxID=3151850 RepID=A0AAU7PKW8_9FIRM
MKHKTTVRGKYLQSSVFVVILWLNLFSIAAVSLFNYFVFHRMSNEAYLKSFIEYNSQVTDLAFSNIDKQIMMSAYQTPQFYFSPVVENDDLLYPQEQDIAGSPERVLALVAEMRRLQKVYPYVKSMDIYYEGTGTVVTGFDKVHFPETQERFTQYLPWLEPWKEGGEENGFMHRSINVYSVEEPVITYVVKLTQHKWKGSSIYLGIHIAKSAFGKYISEQEGSLAILGKEGQVIYDTPLYEAERMSAGAVMAEARRNGIVFEKGGQPVSLNVSGDRQTVFYTVSPDTGLLYLYRVADSNFYQQYNVTKRMFIIGYLVSIAFNLLVLAMITYYNNTAYRTRIQQVSRGAGIDISQATRSFEGTLQVLTSEISSLHQSIDSSKALLFQSAVRSVILNKNPEMGYDKLEPYLTGDCVCTFFLYLSEKDGRKLSVESLQEEYAIGSRPYEVLFTTMENDGLVAVIVASEQNMTAARKSFMKEMGVRWNMCRMVSGRNCSMKKEGVKESYRTAAEAAKYRYIYVEEAWLSYEMLQLEKRKHSGSHLKLFGVMERDIVNENFLDFKTRMEGLIVSFKSRNYDITYCNSTLRDLVTMFYHMMQQYQLDMWVVFGYDIREYYMQIPDIDAFHQWGNYLGESIIRNIRHQKESVDVDLKDKILRIIDENLETCISLDYLADELHMRLDAVSRMFKQMMGKGYAEYIKEQKLNRAIRLLDEGYSVKEIAEQLGYSSSQYFIKVFKEAYGITPLQFKKNRQNKDR